MPRRNAARPALRCLRGRLPLLAGVLALATRAWLAGAAPPPCPVPGAAIVASLPPPQQLQSVCRSKPPSQCPMDCLCAFGQTFLVAAKQVGYNTTEVTKDALQSCVLENLSALLDAGLQLSDLLPVGRPLHFPREDVPSRARAAL